MAREKPIDPHKERLEKVEEDMRALKQQLEELQDQHRVSLRFVLGLERAIAKQRLDHFVLWAQSLLWDQTRVTSDDQTIQRIYACVGYVREMFSRYDERILHSSDPLKDVEEWMQSCREFCASQNVPLRL